MEKTTLYLPPDLQAEVRTQAKREGRSQADIIREALRRYLDQAPRPPLGCIGVGEDEALTGADVEEWIEREWGRD